MVGMLVTDVSLPGHPTGEVISLNKKDGTMSVKYKHGTHHNVNVKSIFLDWSFPKREDM